MTTKYFTDENYTPETKLRILKDVYGRMLHRVQNDPTFDGCQPSCMDKLMSEIRELEWRVAAKADPTILFRE